jgi:hypothetical protein
MPTFIAHTLRLAALLPLIEQLFRDSVVLTDESNEFYPVLSFENTGQQNPG